MANSVTPLTGSMNRLTFLIVLDGTAGPLLISQADIQAALDNIDVSTNTSGSGTPTYKALSSIKPTPPIVSALTTAITAATQALLRAATLDGPCKAFVRERSGVAPAAAADAVPITVDVDTDATTPTKLEINITVPTRVGSFYLDLIAAFSACDGPNSPYVAP